MGCAVSKLDDSPLLSLCKERKELITAATDSRYALASSHILYIQALLDVGDALSRFVDEGVVSSVDPPQNAVSNEECQESECNDESPNSASDDESLTSVSNDESPISVSNGELLGEDEHLVFPLSDSDSDSELGSLSSDIDFHQMELLGLSPERDQIQAGANPNVSHVKSSVKAPSTVYEHHPVYPVTVQWQESPQSDPRHPRFGKEASFFVPMNVPPYDLIHPQDGNNSSSSAPMNVPQYDLMRPQGGNGASFDGPMNFLREDLSHLRGGDGASFNAPINLPSNCLRFPGDGYGASFEVPSNSRSRGLRFPQYGNGMPLGVSMDMWNRVPHDSQVQNIPSAPVLMSAQPELTNWDYFNPFSSTGDIYLNYYSQDRYETESSSNIPDFIEVRQREGIPDLEDEQEQDPMKEAPEKIHLAGHVKGGSGDGVCETAPLRNEGDAEVGSAKELTTRLNATKVIEGEANTAEEGSSDPLEPKTMEEENDRKKEKSLQEVVKEIKGAFLSASNYGKEVSMLLEADKLPYQYTGTIFKVVPSRIWDCIGPSSPTHLPSRQSILRSFKIANPNKKDLEMDVCIKSGNLSSTLEKLCAWEKKLYEEVKDEEKLRVVYDKECKKLKDLAQKGAESSKIEVISVSVRRLLLKINVTMTAVDAISRRINKLQDEELLPQLSELIQGLIRMWTFMAKSHQKQLLDIMEAKPHIQVASYGITGDSGLRSTLKLEMECLKWAKCFGDWVNAQKSFVKFLNRCLLKCIIQEQEETPDGTAPFSPGRVGAPGTFIVCHDWYQAVERMSESRVSEAIHDFASSLHHLWEKQSEEQQHRVKAEYLFKDYERRVRSFYEERGINRSINVTAASGVAGLDELDEKLEFMKKRLDEQRKRHGEAMKQVNDAASSSLRSGMIPIFEALESFCLERLRGYEQIRNPTMGGSIE